MPRDTRPKVPEHVVSDQSADAHSARWKELLKSDPRRAVRALQLTGLSAESVEGDTAWDAVPVIEALQDVSCDPQGQVWKRLVRAGVVGALCQCVIKFGRVTVQHDPAAPPPSKETISEMNRELNSAWYGPLAIICCAFLKCAVPPTPTEQRMVEDLKTHWREVTDRIWHDPANSLTENRRAVLERAVLAQIVMRVTCIDPSLLNIIADPADKTLAICMRNWLHASAREDCVMNASLLLLMLDPDEHLPSRWRAHFDSHPLPPAHTLLSSILADVRSAPGEGGQETTPEQIVQAIVNAATRHLPKPADQFGLPDVFLELEFLRTLLRLGTKGACPALPRAAYKSEPLWLAITCVMRRAAREKAGRRHDHNVFILALNIFSGTLQPIQMENAECANAMIRGWVIAGLLDELDEFSSVLIHEPSGPLNLTMSLYTIKACIPKLSSETLTMLRSQFPRPGMIFQLLISSTMTQEEGDSHHKVFISPGGFLRAENPMWKQGAWQTLDDIAQTVALPGECSNRGCTKPAHGPTCGTRRCKGARYCSQTCMHRCASIVTRLTYLPILAMQ
ncbi:hypothetical protein OH77DRAFT_1401044 [Trametes cingulata]|nr:hypothetical protein OH77DRAFT_1401044 [Trametes cingulata]